MNIFALEHTPQEIALSHTDKHIVKMPTEMAQMISFTYYHEQHPIQSYRNYYRNDKKHLHSWKKRSKPLWL